MISQTNAEKFEELFKLKLETTLESLSIFYEMLRKTDLRVRRKIKHWKKFVREQFRKLFSLFSGQKLFISIIEDKRKEQLKLSF
ncbi:hypothetical protein KC929_02835 [Patescibacteria group bacterium]|nr:hypothetical protein [Patescibacteria group bacterium]